MAHEPFNLLGRYQLIERALQDSHLSRGNCVVLCVILGHVDANGEAWPGMGRICNKAGISKSTAIRAVKRLEERGYLTAHREFGRSNVYVVAEPPDPATSVMGDTTLAKPVSPMTPAQEWDFDEF
ncbi:MAG: helix-turn-helix domain-containing protein [Proteobacteria bacterium]|nr:MAG: helix-turn-helix domain-containing protein [Pseudomonadota bacterium]